MRLGVVGHVEWVEFARVERVPAPGEIVHALESFDEAAGGGAVAAVWLAARGGTTTFLTALGDDGLGRRAAAELGQRGVRVEPAFRPDGQRRAFTYLDARGERTITVIGPRIVPHGLDPLPWEELAACDAVYFTGGDEAALRAARAARVLVATPRALPTLAAAGVELDALVGSGRDAGERYHPGDLDPPPLVVVRTAGGEGGSYELRDGGSGSFAAAALRGPVEDSYGCGDTFAAGLACALGAGRELAEALAVAARWGADCLCGRGPYGALSGL